MTSTDRKMVLWSTELSRVCDIVVAVSWGYAFIPAVAVMFDVIGLETCLKGTNSVE